MKSKRYTEEQIIRILQEVESGNPDSLGLPPVRGLGSYGAPLAQQVQGYGPGFSEAATGTGG